jgi:hypothetical protein
LNEKNSLNVTISNLIISGQRYDNFISVPTFSYEYHILFVPLHPEKTTCFLSE